MIDRAFLNERNLWNRLRRAEAPLVLYGMGNGADKILAALEKIGVEAADFFASDGFVRGHSFHGRRVLSFSEVCEKYGNFWILLAFGSSLPDVMARILRLSERYPLFAPDVPVCGGALFTADFYRENEEKIERARALFADEASVFVYDSLLRYKLTGEISVFPAIDSPKADALTGLLSGGYSAYADLGAYRGETVAEARRFFPGITDVLAFEPSEKSFEKLTAFLASQEGIAARAVPACAWDRSETLLLCDGAGRSTTLSDVGAPPQNGAKLRPSVCEPLDAHCDFAGKKLLLKYDVEGAEREALLGSRETIARNETELILSLYHKSADLFELPLLVHEMLPRHRLYLRKHPYIPAWDVNLYAVKS